MGHVLLSLVLTGAAFATLNRPDSVAIASPLAPQVLPWTLPEPAYRIYVQADGMHRLDYAYLSSAGLPVDSINPETFRMFNMGTEIAIQVTGDGDTQFETGEAIIFYGRSIDSLFYDGLAPTNKYTGENVFWLTYGGPAGLRMTTPDGAASGAVPAPFVHKVHIETKSQNSQYISAYPKEPNADHWYDSRLLVTSATGSRNKDYTLNIAHLASAMPDGSPVPDGLVKVSMLGYADGAHNLRFSVNGNLVFEQANLWSGFEPVIAQASVPSSYFQEGNNSIQIIVYNAGKTFDTVHPNWVEVTYYDDYYAEGDVLAFDNSTPGSWRYQVQGFSSSAIEAYDVTDMAAVRRFINTSVSGSGPYVLGFGDSTTTTRRYITVGAGGWLTPARIEHVVNQTSAYTPMDLLDGGLGAEYVIITHKDFWAEAGQLAQWRDYDFTVALVDVQQVYDQFNGGSMSAEAIHDFLAHAYKEWTPKPEYVVLFGDGSLDMRHYRDTFNTYIPPYLAYVDPGLGETAADNRFVTLEGNDLVPDMHLGRLPANTPAEARAMVDKIFAYENPALYRTGAWNTLFVSDNWETGDGNFYAYSDAIADELVPQASYVVTKAYLDSPDPNATCDTVECRDRITSTLNQPGTLFLSYVGHASRDVWAAEALMDKTLLSTLTNGPCLPVALPMTCYEGSFHDPTISSLAEAAVRMPVHGFIASWSATGFGLPAGHDYLEKGVVEALLINGVERLGPATTYGKQYLADHATPGAYDDLFDTYILIGDPGLRVRTDLVCSELPTAVYIADFRAERTQGSPGSVLVSWRTENELDTIGFYLLRSESGGGFVRLDEELMPAQRAGSDSGSDYSYLDLDASAEETYAYKLEILQADGTINEYGYVEVPGTHDLILRQQPIPTR